MFAAVKVFALLPDPPPPPPQADAAIATATTPASMPLTFIKPPYAARVGATLAKARSAMVVVCRKCVVIEIFLPPECGGEKVGKAVRLGRHRSSVRCRQKEEVMRYMLLICGDEAIERSPEENAAMERAGIAWMQEMNDRGVRLEGSRLRPASEATTVRVRDGGPLLSDGPF